MSSSSSRTRLMPFANPSLCGRPVSKARLIFSWNLELFHSASVPACWLLFCSICLPLLHLDFLLLQHHGAPDPGLPGAEDGLRPQRGRLPPGAARLVPAAGRRLWQRRGHGRGLRGGGRIGRDGKISCAPGVGGQLNCCTKAQL